MGLLSLTGKTHGCAGKRQDRVTFPANPARIVLGSCPAARQQSSFTKVPRPGRVAAFFVSGCKSFPDLLACWAISLGNRELLPSVFLKMRANGSVSYSKFFANCTIKTAMAPIWI